jgi:hypothetical protein
MVAYLYTRLRASIALHNIVRQETQLPFLATLCIEGLRKHATLAR